MVEGITQNGEMESLRTVFYTMKNRLLIYKVKKKFSRDCDKIIIAIMDNICRLYHVLAQFPFTTNETELDYDHQKVSMRLAARVTEQRKT